MLDKFQGDRMKPHTKNGRYGGHGLNWKFWSILSLFSKFTMTILLGKFFYVSTKILKLSWSEVAGP